jgi:nitrite reductase/ring-hydroxylating ferredoxin subunit
MSTNAVADAFPIALQRDIQPRSIVRSKFQGIELIIWRDNSDSIHIWEDRCPHRGVRISAGRNLGDCIQTVYHGWKFGSDGSVIDIPAEEHCARPDIRAKAFPCVIAGGFVWTGHRGELAPPRTPTTLSEDAYLRPIYINAPISVVSEALAEISGFQLWVTPCDDSLSLIMGYVLPRSVPDAVRRGNNLLNRLRRTIEASWRP